MSTLYVNNISSETGTTITIPTGKKLIVTDAGGFTSPGSVIQVVNQRHTTYSSTNSNTYSNTGIQVSITPKFVTSKILVFVQYAGGNTGDFYENCLRIMRDATELTTSERFVRGPSGTEIVGFLQYYDSPSTTSSTSYSVQYKTSGGDFRINDYTAVPNSSYSGITLQEIAQ